MFLKCFSGHNINLRFFHNQCLLRQSQGCYKAIEFFEGQVESLYWIRIIIILCAEILGLELLQSDGNKAFANLLLPDLSDVGLAYRDFCNIIKKAAKKTIPRGHRNNYIPCWNAKCKPLHNVECELAYQDYAKLLHSPQGNESSLAATALFTKLDRKPRDR